MTTIISIKSHMDTCSALELMSSSDSYCTELLSTSFVSGDLMPVHLNCLSLLRTLENPTSKVFKSDSEDRQ